MIVHRALVGLAAIVTALLLQATVVGPIAVAMPVSLPLVVVLSVALLAGPGTGIALGFGAGLLTDLSSSHPVGVLALTWLTGAVFAGRAGGMVDAAVSLGGSRGGSRRRRRLSRPLSSRRPSRRLSTRALHIGRRMDGRRLALLARQAVVVGVVGGAVAVATTLLERATGTPGDALARALARCVPAAAWDALLALAVLPLCRAVLQSTAMRSSTTSRPVTSQVPVYPLAAPEVGAR